MKKVFLCAPLSSDDKENCMQRAMELGEAVLREYGLLPVVPHITASFLDLSNSGDEKLYRAAAKELLWLCDEVWVIGEADSFMTAQIETAKILNIKTRYPSESAFRRKERANE